MGMPVLSSVYASMRAAVHIPLEDYMQYLPRMPHGETAQDLRDMNFPAVGDLLDGLLLVFAFTAMRFLLDKMLFVHFGRAVMKHRYYRMDQDPRLEASLR